MIDWSVLCAVWRSCTAVLYLSSRIDVCCSSCVNVASIWLTCDCVALIWAWFGAGPGRVVEVVAPASAVATEHSSAPSSPAAMAAGKAWVRLRTVPRQFTAPTSKA